MHNVRDGSRSFGALGESGLWRPHQKTKKKNAACAHLLFIFNATLQTKTCRKNTNYFNNYVDNNIISNTSRCSANVLEKRCKIQKAM